MSERNLVIVESPAKAKTINKYLGDDYQVIASYGHVRDLPARDGSVRPDEDFSMDWELGERAKRPVGEIIKAARQSKSVILATDPDREGEAIAWHMQEMLKGKKDLRAMGFQRVTFNEITKRAVLDAMAQPRTINAELVEAYLARRALDYLVGFTLSPVLWRKLPGARSAGRVQSVALRLICERESEIEDFQAREFWTIEGTFVRQDGTQIVARLTHLDGAKLGKFDLANEATALATVTRLAPLSYAVGSVEHKQVRRNPQPPFTTSTLQQEASRKLGMSATQTMRVAQQLYEGIEVQGETVGLITYMRTDGTQLAGEAVEAIRQLVGRTMGETYLPEKPRVYKTKAKNAQEAHEAIRPTDITRRPQDVAAQLNTDQRRLYDLIWKRSLACQMASAVLDQVAVDIVSDKGDAVFRATGSVVAFDGFLKVYEEGRDDSADDAAEAREQRLPKLEKADPLSLGKPLVPDQHFTQPPPRYTEASLVKQMEELGIGRPSTYASILQVLQDRDYVRLEKKRFVTEDRGRLVTAFLSNFFRQYIAYDFTAKLENQLDDISGGRVDWKAVLREFWSAFSAAVHEIKDLSITEVIDALDADLGAHFFRDGPDGSDPRLCPSCGAGRLGLRLSRTGAFIGCSSYPECRYTRPLEVVEAGNGGEADAYPRALGDDPESGLPVSVRKGPFGFYIQLGPREGANEEGKPKRVSLTSIDAPGEIELERALGLLSLPRDIGVHPTTGEALSIGIGRYGPYVKAGRIYKSLPNGEDILAVPLDRAAELVASGAKRAGAEPLKVLGTHPTSGETVGLFEGRYGPYVRAGRGKLIASLPKSLSPDDLTFDKAMELLDAKASKTKGKGGTGKAKAPARASKTGAGSAKKTAAAKKKPAAGKQTAAKAAAKAPAKTAPAGETG